MHQLPVFPDLEPGPVVSTGAEELLRAAGAFSRRTFEAINH
jgi:hypothetical protein